MAKHKYIESPEHFLKLWDEYKAKIDANPAKEQVATGKGIFTIEKKRPYQRNGFESYVYANYGFHVHQYIDECGKKDSPYAEYLGVVTHIRNEWTEDQIDGTLTGIYKAPNLVARLNGLADNQKTDLNAKVVTSKIVYEPTPGNDPIKES